MAGIEIAGLVLGAVALIGLVPTFKEGVDRARSWGEKKRFRLLGFKTPNTEVLESEAQNGETTVARQYHGFHSAYGNAFKRGDGIAREALQALIIQLQQGLITQLKNAQDGKKIKDISSLVSVTVKSRVEAIVALSELAQRLAIATPIERYPPMQYHPINDWGPHVQYNQTNNMNPFVQFHQSSNRKPSLQYNSPNNWNPQQYNSTSNQNPSTQYNPTNNWNNPFMQYYTINDMDHVSYVPPSMARRGAPGPPPRLLEYPSTKSTNSYHSAPQVIHVGNCKKVNNNSYKSCIRGRVLPIPRKTSGPPQRCERCHTRLTVDALTKSAQYQQG